MRIAIVLTTINIPYVVAEHLAFARATDRVDEVDFVIVGDHKSHQDTQAWLRKQDWDSTSWVYFDPGSQEVWLESHARLRSLLPWNSIQRRNLGYIAAYERGADVIISIDDDNFPLDPTFLDRHRSLGVEELLPVYSDSSGWMNVCEALEFEGATVPYHRGFPSSKRHQTSRRSVEVRQVTPMVNAGLWLGDPDIDAASRIAMAPVSKRYSASFPARFALDPSTVSPFNSQNTAFHSTLLPVMYLIVMGGSFEGAAVDRYDDIWMSFVAQRVMSSLGHVVSYGDPIVEQRRNDHDPTVDLLGEAPGMYLTERFVEALASMSIDAADYLGGYRQVCDQLIVALTKCGASAAELQFWAQTVAGMYLWLYEVESVMGAGA